MFRSRLRLVFVLTTLLALLIGPSFQPAQAQNTSGTAWIRAVNASPDASGISIFINNQPAAKGIAPGNQFGFSVPAGKHQVSFRRADTIINNAVADLDLADGDFVTVVALNKAADLQILVLKDDASAVTRGMARVRVFNAIVGGSNIDVTAGDQSIASNVAFGAASDYTLLVNGTTTFKVNPAGDASTVLATAANFELKRERRYDIFVVGVQGGKSAAYPLEGTTEKASGNNQVQFANFAPGAKVVDMVMNSEDAFNNVTFGNMTSWLVVAPGAYKVDIYAYNKRDKILASGDVTVEKDQSVFVAVVGKAEELAVKSFALDYKPLRVGQTRVQLVHMAPNKPEAGLDTTGGVQLVAPVAAGSGGSAEVGAGGMNLRVSATDGSSLGETQVKGAQGTASVVIVYERTATGATGITTFSYPVNLIVPVRFVHASTQAKAVDVYLDGDKILSDWGFGASTDYVDVAPGKHQLRAFETGKDPADSASVPVIDRTLDVSAFSITAVMYDQTGKPVMTLYPDNLNQIAKGKARVRLIQASPDVGTVKWANADGTPMSASAIGLGEASGTVDLTAGSYTFVVSSISDKNVVLRVGPVKLEAGSFVTFVVTGPTADAVLTLTYQVSQTQ